MVPKKKTHDEYVAELAAKSPNITVLEQYINSRTPILHQCKIDNYTWKAVPHHILEGHGCPLCAGNARLTQEQYLEMVNNINPNIEVLESYINATTPILHKCKLDGYEWKARPYAILGGNGCPKCAGNNKKTTEEYKQELAKINPNIKVLGEYINSSTPILHKCKIDGNEWYASPSNELYGRGCPECKRNTLSQQQRKTHEEYIKELAECNPYVEVIEQYVDARTPILHRCLRHNICWKITPSNALRGDGCPECKKEKIKIKNTKSHEQYVSELAIVNPNIEVLEEYIDSKTPVLYRCKIDGYVWKAAPSSVLSGHGCPMCARLKLQKQRTKNHKQYIKEVSIINPNIEVLEQYIDAKTPIQHRCKIDGYIWKPIPSSVLCGYGCPMCAGNILKTTEQYKDDVAKINPDIEVMDEYVNARTPILHRCKLDGYQWMAVPANILSGSGCPQCQESSGERVVRQLLEYYGIQYIYQKTFQDCKDIQMLPFDFYLPHYNKCIEYDGKQHFEPVDFAGKGKEWAQHQLYKTQYHDQIKNTYCSNNNIPLLRIPYFKNIEEELNNFLFI